MSFLQRVCANDLSQPVGSVMHTAMLNERGRYENDCSIARTAPGQFLVVSSPGQARRPLTCSYSNSALEVSTGPGRMRAGPGPSF